jgi:O-antigen/teichoic acid export membrane protein
VFLDALADFGTKIMGVRELAAGEKETTKGIFWLRTVMAIIATIFGGLMVIFWSGYRDFKNEAGISLLMILLTSLAGFLEIIWQAKLKMGKKVIVDLMFPLLFLGWILTVTRINLVGVLIMYVLARGISLMWGYWWVKNDFGLKELGSFSKKEVIKAFKLSWPMGVYMLAFASYDRVVDSMMIKTMLGAKEVAWYGLGYKIYGVLIQPAYFFVNSIFPLLSSKIEGKKKLFWEAAGLLLAGVVMLVAGVQTLAPWMVTTLAGNSFEPTVTVLRILSLACLFSYFGHLVGFTLIAKGGQKDLLKVAVVGLIFNVTMNLIMIPRFGINGAAMVTVGNEILGLGMMGWMLKKKTK